jgi:hypothetical protein
MNIKYKTLPQSNKMLARECDIFLKVSNFTVRAHGGGLGALHAPPSGSSLDVNKKEKG